MLEPTRTLSIFSKLTSAQDTCEGLHFQVSSTINRKLFARNSAMASQLEEKYPDYTITFVTADRTGDIHVFIADFCDMIFVKSVAEKLRYGTCLTDWL